MQTAVLLITKKMFIERLHLGEFSQETQGKMVRQSFQLISDRIFNRLLEELPKRDRHKFLVACMSGDQQKIRGYVEASMAKIRSWFDEECALIRGRVTDNE